MSAPPGLPREAWQHYKAAVWWRAAGKCEVPWCRRDLLAWGGLDPHHVQPRSAGGGHGPDNLTALCRWCHDRVSGPLVRGRLEIAPSPTPTASGAPFTYRLVYP